MGEARLLTEQDGPAVAVENAAGRSAVVLACEHASNRIPEALGRLGLDDAVLQSHAAWDIGALALARRLSAALDAPLVRQRFSRLVYDCNRPPESANAIPSTSEIYSIPANRALTASDRARRIGEVYEPFHAALARVLDEKRESGTEPLLVTIHSFTRHYWGQRRTVDFGVLHDADARLADRILVETAGLADCAVRRNEPYGPADGVTHTLRRQALPGGIGNVMFEIANDLIDDPAGQAFWADRLAGLLQSAAIPAPAIE